MKFQVVEKDDYGTDWALVRDDKRNTADRFETKEEATKAATVYITGLNCDNALTHIEKRGAIEAFMMTDGGCFLGVLDKKDWYLTYPKDIMGKDEDGKPVVVHEKHTAVVEAKYFELEGKTQVAVRPVPGT